MLNALLTILTMQTLDPNQVAIDFLNTLTPTQKQDLIKPFQDDYRTFWQFVPAQRQGLNLGQLNPTQTEKARNLLKHTLSPHGLKTITQIELLEDVLKEIENNPGRDRNLYTFTFFGEPNSTSAWGWRYEGHHISLNFTYQGSKLVSSTPLFLGSNPANVLSGEHKNLRTLPDLQDLAFDLLNSLSPEQKKQAILAPQAPPDIFTSNQRKASILEKQGLHYSSLTANQKEKLLALIKAHNNVPNQAEQDRRWKSVEPQSLIFAWLGSSEPNTQGHYYRIQGSRFLIEYDNIQNNANHIHTVWRDFENDFGPDSLAQHYQKHRH